MTRRPSLAIAVCAGFTIGVFLADLAARLTT